jgi:hypothetical protein
MTDQPQVTPVFVDLTGPQSIRARFWPKQILNIPDVAFVVGLTREGLYKQIRLGQCSLRIQTSGSGLMKVRIDDLIAWLYPEQIQAHPVFSAPSDTTTQAVKRKPGRPRKTVDGGAR